MKIAIIGAGNIGGNLAKQFAKAGYEVYICFSRSESALRDKAAQIGHGVQAASVQEAVAQSEVIVLAAQWAHGRRVGPGRKP